MKRKFLYYAVIPAFALLVAGTGVASAHGFGFMGKNLTPQEIATNQTQRFTQTAAMLGISVDDVKNAWAQGKTLQELATEKGITQDQLQTKLKAQMEQKMKEQLQALVSQGVITQAQADQRLEFMQTRSTNPQGKHFGKHLKGGMGMMGL